MSCEMCGKAGVNVTTNAHIDCVFDAVFATDDDLMGASLRRVGHVEDVPE